MDFRSLIPFREYEKGEWSPFKELDRMRHSVLKDLEYDLFGGFPRRSMEWVTPRVDVSETDEAFIVSAELPGLDENDVEVELANQRLTIKGEKKIDREEKGKDYHRIERASGSFQRSIDVPYEASIDKVDATFKKGVLTISIPKPKQEKVKVKKITVKSGD